MYVYIIIFLYVALAFGFAFKIFLYTLFEINNISAFGFAYAPECKVI